MAPGIVKARRGRKTVHVEGKYTFNGPREEVFRLLLDPVALKGCIPGCESMEAIGPDEYEATMKVGVAAVRGTYKGHVKITDRVDPERYRMSVQGRGGPGFVRGEATITLEDQGNSTVITVEG